MTVAMDWRFAARRLAGPVDVHQLLCAQFPKRYRARLEMLAQALRGVSAIARDMAPGAEISGRVKSFRSSLFKMRARHFDIDQVLDAIGVRVILHDEKECYRLVERIHSQFKIMEDEYDDYIVKPKRNGYRSLHTTILASGDHPVEVQVRTRSMHAVAEHGTAAHWRYKQRFEKRLFHRTEGIALHSD